MMIPLQQNYQAAFTFHFDFLRLKFLSAGAVSDLRKYYPPLQNSDLASFINIVQFNK